MLLTSVSARLPANFGFGRLRVIACGMALSLLLGCKTPDQTTDIMLLLQEGKARGHLVLTTDGQVGGGVTNGFYFGLGKSSLSFDGDVNFADADFFDGPPEPEDGEGE